MCSSHQSSPRRTKGAGPCPTCGSKRVIKVAEDVMLRIGGHRYCFDKLNHERCLNCGERIFDIDASKRFDAILKRGRRRAA